MDRASSPSESAGVVASAAGGEAPTTSSSSSADQPQQPSLPPTTAASSTSAASQQQRPPSSRYESQKRRDWRTFQQYLRNRAPPLTLARCGGTEVIEFLRYLDQFGKTRVHVPGCPHYGRPDPPAPCACPLRQAWGSLDALIGRLRGAYDESGGQPEHNPFAARAVASYLKEVRSEQAKARGIPYEKRRRRRGAAAGARSSTTPGSTSTSIREQAPSSEGGDTSGLASVTVPSSGAIATDTTDVGGGAAPGERPSSPAPPLGGSSHSAS